MPAGYEKPKKRVFHAGLSFDEAQSMNPMQESREDSQLWPRGKMQSSITFKTDANMKTSRKKTRIVIVGGGFAGFLAAKELDRPLARRPDIGATLISRETSFSLLRCCTRSRPVISRRVTLLIRSVAFFAASTSSLPKLAALT